MGLRIVYGRSGSGKSEFCFSEIANLIEKEKKIYVITPEQFSFTAEKKLMDKMSKIKKLTKCGKAMLIYYILNSKKKELKFLSKSDENINVSMSAITELKKHCVTT